MQKVCFVCLQPSRLKCSRCDAVHYCGKECQKKDWKVHKHNCQDNNINIDIEINSSLILFRKSKSYLEQGNYVRAEKGLRKLLEPSVRSQLPSVIIVEGLNFLSLSLHNQGKYTEAIEIAEECLKTSRLKLGSNHSCTLNSMNTLSKSYIQLRKFNDAYELTNECIKTSTIVNGKDHGATLYHMLSLIDIYTFEGRHEEAQKLLREYIAKINKDDIQYLDILCRLASTCISTSQYEEGQKLYEECLEKCRSQQGGNHPLTISIMMNLANVYEEQNKFVQAENIRKECLAKSIVINGKDHPHTILAMKSLAKK